LANAAKGKASVRIEANYDQRITQRLIALPADKLNFAAQDVQEIGMGAGPRRPARSERVQRAGELP
jgi:copper resistance protein B